MMDPNPTDAGLMMAYPAYLDGDLAAVRGVLKHALRDPVLLLPHRVWLTSRADNS